jgi:tRNA pseudouridine38-40 synthase
MRIALGIEYDGSGFAGWQWQPNRRTVQACVEQALSQVADEAVKVICAGRTDAGVHALEQVVHFDTQAARAMRAWILGANSALPDDVRVLWARPVKADFHARYSALARFYRYIVLNRPMTSALLRRQVTWHCSALEAERMQAAAGYLTGEHDFSSFRGQACQSRSPRRRVYFIHVYRRHERIFMDIAANAFLHHMVRNIAGVLIEIGAGKREPGWARQVLEFKDRKLGGVTAPPDGLYLAAVYYPETFGIAKHPMFDHLPADASRFDSPTIHEPD